MAEVMAAHLRPEGVSFVALRQEEPYTAAIDEDAIILHLSDCAALSESSALTTL